MRYFVFNYVYKNQTNIGFGRYFVRNEVFPSIADIENDIEDDIMIISYIEFNNEDDYLSAQGTSRQISDSHNQS